jgi:hypothetical protein
MITFTTRLRIARPLGEVFAYVSNPLNYPHWNSAVAAAQDLSRRRRRRLDIPDGARAPDRPRDQPTRGRRE